MLSAGLCSSILGQIALDGVVKTPKPGEESYELFNKEKEAVLASLKQQAQLVADTFNATPNIRGLNTWLASIE